MYNTIICTIQLYNTLSKRYKHVIYLLKCNNNATVKYKTIHRVYKNETNIKHKNRRCRQILLSFPEVVSMGTVMKNKREARVTA